MTAMYNYGIKIEPQFGYSFKDIYDILHSAEKNDFTHAWFSDHFMLDENSEKTFCIECFTAMMATLSKTEKLRVGSLVFSNSYRYPAVLAKQIASLDHFSNGSNDEKEKNQFYEKLAKKRGIRLKQTIERYSGALHGTIEEIKERIKEYKKIGITYFVFMFPYKEEKNYIEIFNKEIL